MFPDKIGSVKSNEIADKARAEGNKSLIEKNFFNALVKYNESLCYSENGSETIGLAYANRSAVYYELKLFEKCLKNIELARLNGYPHKNILILDKREEKCLEHIAAGAGIKYDEDLSDFIKLSYESNPKIPFISNCLELKINEKFGRHIVTNRELKVGDIVAIEKPFFKVMKSDSRYDCCEDTYIYQRCALCLKINLLDLIPCGTCSSTMFCSEKCHLHTNQAFHKYECPINDSLLSAGVMQMAMRIFYQPLTLFDGSINDLEKFFNENENASTSVYDFDSSDSDDRATARNNLIALICLARNDKDYSCDSPEKLFNIHPQLSHMWESNEAFIRKFILRTLQTGDCNFHGICGWSIKKYANQIPQMIGIGCYPFMSLINHSCSPNISRIYVDDKMLLLVERPIMKGEQIFDCYKHTFFTQPKSQRQYNLLNSYGFSCDCVACKNDFPLFHRLKTIDKIILKAAKKGKSELSKLDGYQAKKRFKEYCEIIQRHHAKAFPSTEIVLLQECLLQCISIGSKLNAEIP